MIETWLSDALCVGNVSNWTLKLFVSHVQLSFQPLSVNVIRTDIGSYGGHRHGHRAMAVISTDIGRVTEVEGLPI